MLTNKVAFGALWLLVGKFLSHIIALGGMVIVARLLMPEDMGIIYMAMGMMAIIGSLTDLPVAMALIQIKDPTKKDFDTAFTMQFIRGMVVATTVTLMAWPIAQIFDDDRFQPLMLVLAIYPFLSGLRNSNFEVKAREMKFSFEFRMMLTAKIASFLVTVALAYYWRSYWAIVFGQLTLVGVQSLMTYVLCPVLPGISLKNWRKLFNFSIWLGVGWFVNQVNWRSDVLLAGGVLGKSTAGHYTVGAQLTQESSQMIIQAALRSLFAAFSQIQDDLERMRRGYLNAQAVSFAVVMPLMFGLGAVADKLIPLIYGEKWLLSVIVVQMTAPVAAFATLNGPAQSIALALGNTRTIFFRDVMALMIRLPLVVTGLFQYELFGLPNALVGILTGHMISAAIMLMINFAMVKRFLDLPVWRQITNVLRQLSAGIVMVGAVWAARQVIEIQGGLWQQLLLIGLVSAIGAATYIAISLVSWLIMGRPVGLESKLGDAIAKVRSKISERSAANEAV